VNHQIFDIFIDLILEMDIFNSVHISFLDSRQKKVKGMGEKRDFHVINFASREVYLTHSMNNIFRYVIYYVKQTD
jgi:hypothetical protein